MLAVLYDPKQKPHGLRLATDAPKPACPPNGLLVRVHAAAINPVDYKMPKIPFVKTKGRPAGLDLAGVVAEVGSEYNADGAAGSDAFAVGDAVFGNSRGALAAYVACNPGKVARVPAGCPLVDAASLPTVGLTALQALRANGCTAGANVLVIGASGGCGSAAVMVAGAMGAARVAGVCSAANAALVRGLPGCADAALDVVDYTACADLSAAPALKGTHWHTIFDTVTSPEKCDRNYRSECRRLLAGGGGGGGEPGRLVSANGSTGEWLRLGLSKMTGFRLQKKRFDLVLTDHSRADLEVLAGWVAEGKLRALVDTVVPAAGLTQAAVDAAFTQLKSRRTKGKIVFELVAGAAAAAGGGGDDDAGAGEQQQLDGDGGGDEAKTTSEKI